MRKWSLTLCAVVGLLLIAPNIALGQAVTLATWTGTVTAPNSLNPQGSSTYADVKTITLQAGGSYIFANYSYQYSVNFTSGYSYDDYGYLLDPNNRTVAQDDDSNGYLQFKMTYTATISGTFTCVITLWSPLTNTKMQYQVVVTGPPGPSTTTPGGIPYVQVPEPNLGWQGALASANLVNIAVLNSVELPQIDNVVCALTRREC